MFPAVRERGKIFDEAIRNLDRTIADEKAILRLKESRADSLRRECRSSADAASRFLTVKALYEEYSRYDIDSAFYYVHLNREIAGKSGRPEMIFDADLDLADRYRISGMFNDALEVVDTMDNLTINHTIHLQRGRVLGTKLTEYQNYKTGVGLPVPVLFYLGLRMWFMLFLHPTFIL